MIISRRPGVGPIAVDPTAAALRPLLHADALGGTLAARRDPAEDRPRLPRTRVPKVA